MSNDLTGVSATKNISLNKIWLNLLCMEFLLAGFLLCLTALFAIEIHTDYSFHLIRHGIYRQLLAEGVALLLIGGVILTTPKINAFLRINKITAYLIPMHLWILLVLLVMEIALRIIIYNPPFNSVRTNWFGWAVPQGSYTLWGKEGYAITRFSGKIPGEIQTPFEGGEDILVLGDSFTEALQVPNDQKYASVAESILYRDGYNFDLHNLGDSGLAMADYVSRIPKYKTLYNPKAIIVQLKTNDFIEAFNKEQHNYFVAKNSQIVDIIHTEKIKGKFSVADTLSPNFIFTLWEHGQGRFGALKKEQKTTPPALQTSDATLTEIQQFDANLAKQEMNLLLEASDEVPLILIVLPSAPRISGGHMEINDPEHESLMSFLSNYPQVILVDPLAEFQNLALSGYLPMGFFNSTNPGSGHLNRYGHEILGKLVAQTIEASLK